MDGQRIFRLLLADDDEDELVLMRDRLDESSSGTYVIEWTPHYDEAVRWLEERPFDVALIDYRLGERSGLELIREVAGDDAPPLILMTGQGDGEVDRAAMRAGAVDYLDKKRLSGDRLERSIRYAITHHEAVRAVRQRSDWFRALIEYAEGGIVTLESTGSLTYVSPSVLRMLGFDEPELVGHSFYEFVHPEDMARAQAAFERCLASPGEPVSDRIRVRRKSDDWRVLTGVVINRLDDPLIRAIVVNFSDVTDREITEIDLEARTALFEAVFAEASDAMLIADDDARYVAANAAGGALLGMDARDVVGLRVEDFVPPSRDPRGDWEAFLAAGRASGQYQLIRRDGAVRDVEFAAVANVLPGRHLSVLRDVTTRVHAEKELDQLEGKLRGLFQSSVSITFREEDGQISEANNAFLDLVGWSRQDLEAGRLTWQTMTPPEFFEITEKALDEARRHGRAAPFEKQYLRPGGARVWVLVSLARLPGAIPRYASLAVDITRQKKAEQALLQSERMFAAIFSNSPAAVYLAEVRSDRIVEANDAFLELIGYGRDEVVGRTTEELGVWLQADVRDPAMDRIRAGDRVSNLEALFKHRSGDDRHVLVSMDGLAVPGLEPVFAAVMTDITGQRRVEAQYRQAQKMEAVGRLAGGIAHDFNNLLTAILGYAEMLTEQHDTGHTILKSDIEEILNAGRSAAGLTQQLLAFSRQQVMAPRILDLNVIVVKLQSLLRRTLGEHIAVTTTLGQPLDTVLADPVQIEQVLMNLALNARDAMPSGGRLTIETANVMFDLGDAPGRHVMLAVTDTGLGMDETVKNRLFEPFFTTKEVGKGTGLGLATVYGIVKQMSGSILVYSEVGHGTTFKVYLPASADDVAAATPEAKALPLSGRETILLVEDQEGVRRLAKEVLTRNGYTVIPAATPREALNLAASGGTRFDLLLTDIVMPEMEGRRLARLIHEIAPGLRTVYMSGYTEAAIGSGHVPDLGLAFLQKPFTPRSLLLKVREVLDAPGPPAT